MNRRDSFMNSNDIPQSSTNSTTQDLAVAEYQSATSSSEDYDATAAALSRLSVMNEHNRADGTASPQLNGESTYEMAIITSCPSPSKRSSEFFEPPLDENDLKRMRREKHQHSAFIDVTHTFTSNFSDCTPETEHIEHEIRGLGLDSLCGEAPGSPSSTFSRSQGDLLISPMPLDKRLYNLPPDQLVLPQSCLRGRRRSRSLPSYLSVRWLESSRCKKQKNTRSELVSHSSGPVEPLLRRPKEPAVISPPPITQTTLRELELSEIFKNAQLRHDIVHDPNLQFRPNTDGERGAKKRHQSNKYWRSIARELDEVRSMPRAALSNTRLSVMFIEMKAILLSLVPVSEKKQVEASFDHELFMQTLNHDLFSPHAFAQYMSALMKRHCAPMRDEAIDRTVRKLETATSSAHFADSLKDTFDVLETMKLDVANHQLRTLRGYLLDTSVEFEKNWFRRKYESGYFSRRPPMSWYKEILASYVPRDQTLKDSEVNHKAAFVQGFMGLFRCISKPFVPSTFSFDQARITALSKDIKDLANLNVVLLLAKQMIKGLSDEDISNLKSEIWSIMVTERHTDKWVVSTPSIAIHLAARGTATEVIGKVIVPDVTKVNFATSWLTSHLATTSPVFSLMHSRLNTLLEDLVYQDMTTTTFNGQRVGRAIQWGVFSGCQIEVESIATRLIAVAGYHWKVHGSEYITRSKEKDPEGSS